jgi:hypothetical protein
MVLRKSFTVLISHCHAALTYGLKHRQRWSVMKQRNFVAKYAQRSGAGKHKEKPMREYNYDDWNDADQQGVPMEMLEILEARISELEENAKNAEDDEVFILSKIMDLQDTAIEAKAWAVVGKLEYIIGLHSATVYAKARQLLNKDKENNV